MTIQKRGGEAIVEHATLTVIGHPVPELPVAEVERAQKHYRDALGFEIGYHAA